MSQYTRVSLQCVLLLERRFSLFVPFILPLFLSSALWLHLKTPFLRSVSIPSTPATFRECDTEFVDGTERSTFRYDYAQTKPLTDVVAHRFWIAVLCACVTRMNRASSESGIKEPTESNSGFVSWQSLYHDLMSWNSRQRIFKIAALRLSNKTNWIIHRVFTIVPYRKLYLFFHRFRFSSSFSRVFNFRNQNIDLQNGINRNGAICSESIYKRWYTIGGVLLWLCPLYRCLHALNY